MQDNPALRVVSVQLTESKHMLNDPLYLVTTTDVVNSIAAPYLAVGDPVDTERYNLVDLTPNGSKRIASNVNGESGLKGVFTVNHSLTKENAPYATERTVVRINHEKFDPNAKLVTASAYLVLVQPVGTASFSPGSALAIARQLAGFALAGDAVWTSGTAGVQSSDTALALARLAAGEP